ncbi:unannotated protein [freshwater metagenome]|uniref:Unannotated protein n=1 Tax=freshwater metagenome TaxID=449393 RepID=A0A6J7RZV2_9ZZZZ
MDAVGEPWEHVATFDIIGNRLRVAFERITEP